MKNKLIDVLLKQGYSKIPLKNNGAGHFKLTAKVNGKNGRFILDTGASHTVIDEASAEKFSLKISGKTAKDAGGLGTDALKTRKSTGNELNIKGFILSKAVFAVIDLAYVNSALQKNGSEKIDGVIGADILKKHKALIDYSEKALYLK